METLQPAKQNDMVTNNNYKVTKNKQKRKANTLSD